MTGGFAKGYREKTGKAGFVLAYNSYGLVLSANKVFESIQKVIETEDEIPTEIIVRDETLKRRRVGDTDIGKELREQIDCLEELLEAYRNGRLIRTIILLVIKRNKYMKIKEFKDENNYIEKIRELNQGKTPRYYILTMGCLLNENDSEKLAGMIEKMGFTKCDNPKEADLIVFNTCCVRENAEEKLFRKVRGA